MQIELQKEIIKRFEEDDIVLPTLPDAAFEANTELAKDDVDIDLIISIIKKDSALAASVIKFANSPLFKGVVNTKTIEQACVRIGTQKLKGAVMSFALQQIFFADDIDYAFEMSFCWRQAANGAVCSAALVHSLQSIGRFTHLDADIMFLIGLVHNIGCLPVLSEADRLSKEGLITPSDKNQLIEDPALIGAPLNRLILTKWLFDEAIIEPASQWISGSVDSDDDYANLLTVALTTLSVFDKDKSSSIILKASQSGILPDNLWLTTEEYKQSVILFRDIL